MKPTIQRILLGTCGAALLACASTSPVDRGTQTMEESLGEYAHVKFRNVTSFPGEVVCGEFSPSDHWGASIKFRRFIVRHDHAYHRPTEDDWHIYCSENPAEQLQTRLGIGPVTSDNVALQKIRRDIHRLRSALQEYLADHGVLPTTQQGLEMLIAPPQNRSRHSALKRSAYIDALPVDPWGRPYRYWRSRIPGDERAMYDIRSLGADGIEGGSNENADIGLKELTYIDHVAAL